MPQYRYVIGVSGKTDCNDLGEPAVVVAGIGDRHTAPPCVLCAVCKLDHLETLLL
jgi:hypothetical protein